MLEKNTPYRVFLSYTHEDAALAREIVADLRASNLVLDLSPGEPVARVPSDLEHEPPVPSFVKEASGSRALYWEAAKYKRSR